MSAFARFGSPGYRFQAALTRCAPPAPLLRELEGPKRVVELRFPLERDDGSVEYLNGIRICYNDRRGPSKGGVRFIPIPNRDDLLSLSFLMMAKCAVNNLPHGGAAGALAIDPSFYSDAELIRAARAYVRAFFPWIGEDRDILSPDQNTGAALMAEMSREYDALAGRSVPGAINGKPPELQGSQGRHGATALGAVCVLEEYLKDRKERLDGKKVAVQGFGNAGATLALELFRRGAKIVAICDSQVGLYDERGLNIPELISNCDARRKTNIKTISADRVDARRFVPSDIFSWSSDIFVPAAVSNQLTGETAAKLDTKLVLEIANGCTDPAGEKSLLARGVEILPDLLANAGGVTVSHFEWVQNRKSERWTKEEVHSKLEQRMRLLACELLDVSRKMAQPLTVGAHIMGLQRFL